VWTVQLSRRWRLSWYACRSFFATDLFIKRKGESNQLFSLRLFCFFQYQLAFLTLQDCPSKDDIIEAFSVFDMQGNGYIPLRELQHVLKNLGEGLDDQILQKLAQITEPDQDQQVCCFWFCFLVLVSALYIFKSESGSKS
jgi:hypothetical protein